MVRRYLSARLTRISVFLLAATALTGFPSNAHASSDIVLYASEASVTKGHWAPVSDSTAAGGRLMGSLDQGWSTTEVPLASPSHYFEMTFDAPANTPYRIWIRARAGGNSKWNDSVWVQFSDSLVGGSSRYRIGTTSALMVNLERCNACGVSGWGWQNTAYWLNQTTVVSFSTSGKHTIRVQTREDGVQIDQIVLSPSTYYSKAPGSITNDNTKLAKSSGSASGGSGSTPYGGTPRALPGTVYARDFDQGGQNVAYYDTSSGNAGGAYRSTDVDLQSSSEGGHNVGWTTPGEWLKYTVNVTNSGNYTVRLRVASPNSGTQVGVSFDKSGVSKNVDIPNTGGWQNWRTVEFPATLSSGTQVLTVKFPQGAVNLHRIEVAAASSTPSPSPSGPYSGSPVSLPGTVEASRFDNGGQGVAYFDTTPGNSGSAFRNTDVDLQAASGGGYNVGWTDAGEWLNYTVKVASAGNYNVTVRVATTSSRTLEVSFKGVSKTLSIPNTGGWQNWTNVSTQMSLSAGEQVLRVRWPTGGVNLRSITVQPVTSGGGSGGSGGSGGGSGGTFRMMTWNIQHGVNKSGKYDPYSQAKFIASQDPHVVVLQEVQTWDENQPARFKAWLESLTGVSWHVQWAPVIDKSATEGNVVLTRLPVVSSTYHQMHATGDWTAMYSNRSVAQATVLVGGVQVHVFSTHLDYYNTSHRTAQLLDMMNWAEKFGPRRIVAGDFNSWWGEYWITTMKGDYYDTWYDLTKNNDGGYTVNNAVRFDYLFRSKLGADNVTPLKVFVPVTTLSDHNPVIADFKVTPP